MYLKLYRSRKMEVILDFLGECWKNLGLPEQVQFDNAREIVGWGPGRPLPVPGCCVCVCVLGSKCC
ncbi:MAG: hypothetical protein MZV64_62925 [Ignavibacteriales bacterium]|nr:hypothetical protein [Ignavibacteriales bacterium]